MNAPVRPDEGVPAFPVPEHDLPMGTLVELGGRTSAALRVLKVIRRWPRRGTTPSRVELMDVDSGMPTFLDDLQIAMASVDGEFRIVEDGEGNVIVRKPTLIERTPEQEARCARIKAYVEPCLAEPRRRSRAGLVPLIRAVAEARGEKAPGFSTVLGWVDLWDEQGPYVKDACFIRQRNKGFAGHKLASDLVAKAVDRGVLGSHRLRKGGGADALAIARAWLEQNHPDVVIAEVDWPSIRTFQYRRAALDRYVADGITFGWGYAARKHTPRYARPRPELPLMEVECDHTSMDVLVVDEASGLVFGRPDLVAFRDRCTGMCLGFAIGFEKAGYPAFLAGLKHAMYPKHMGEYPGVEPWFAFGRFKRLYVDNGLHFIGHNIRRAAEHLGFEIAEFLPGEPWLKGAEEKLLGLINKEVHELPGSTFSNTVERKLFEEVGDKPVVTIGALRAFVTHWVCNDWNISRHEGLGILDTLAGVPRDLWTEGIEKVRLMPLPEERDFVALAGDSDHRCVTKKGIRWDHIRYQGPGLSAIRRHPDHVNGRVGVDRPGIEHPGTRYLVRRDPQDLGSIYVINPYAPDDPAIKVPAIRQDYAAGLTLHQHRVIVRNAELTLRGSVGKPEHELLRTRARMAAFVAKLMTDKRVRGIQQKLAAFLGELDRRHDRSVVHPATHSPELSRDLMDPREPAPLARPVDLSPNAARSTPVRPPAPGTEDEPFRTGGEMPTRADRGTEVAAALRARAALLEADAGTTARDQPWDTDDDILAPRAEPDGAPIPDVATASLSESPEGAPTPRGGAGAGHPADPADGRPSAPAAVDPAMVVGDPIERDAANPSDSVGDAAVEGRDADDGRPVTETGSQGPIAADEGPRTWGGTAGFPVNPDGVAWDEE